MLLLISRSYSLLLLFFFYMSNQYGEDCVVVIIEYFLFQLQVEEFYHLHTF